MDDVKLYRKSDYELDGLLNTLNAFSDDIGMTFGLGNVPKQHLSEEN